MRDLSLGGGGGAEVIVVYFSYYEWMCLAPSLFSSCALVGAFEAFV